MRFVCSELPNSPEESSVCPVEGREHAKVYPFTVSLPRYASWRGYVRTLLNQLKSCPSCRAAADSFPISSLPKIHKLPNGKVLIFKCLTGSASNHSAGFSKFDKAADDCRACNPQVGSYVEPTSPHQFCQSISTMHKPGVEEYDMVSIDPNCPWHGKYSLTAWLRKEVTKVAGVKGGQIVPKAKESKNYHIGRIKGAPKTDGARRSISSDFWKALDKFYEHMLDKDVVEKPSKRIIPSALKKRKSENFEPTVLKQIETNMAAKPSVLSQKQPNILSTYSQQKDLVAKPRQFGKALIPISNKGFGKDIRKCPATYVSQYRRMSRLKELNYRNCFDSCNEAVLGNSEKKQQHEAVSEMETSIQAKMSVTAQECVHEENDNLVNDTAIELIEDLEQSATAIPSGFTIEEHQMASAIFDMKELEQTRLQLKCVQLESDNLVNETRINDEPSTCKPTWFTIEEHQMASDIPGLKELEQIRQQLECVQHENYNLVNETRIKLVGDEPSACTPSWFTIKEHQMTSDIFGLKEPEQTRQQLKCVENDNLVNETRIKVEGDEPSTCTPNRFTMEEQQRASSIFDMKELEQTRQRLEKIADTAKALQLRLKDHPHSEDTPIVKVHLTKVQVVNRNEAREWLSNMAIERATNKISDTCNGGRVRQLVQAFESIK